MRNILALNVLLFWGFSLQAQVAIPVHSQLLQKTNVKRKASSSKAYVAVVNDFFQTEDLIKKGAKVGSRIGNIITIRGSENSWEYLSTYVGFDYLQVAQKVTPNMARALPDLRAKKVHIGEGLTQKYTGKDVIIGITDWGFDYTHPMFYDTALQHTRILAAWDQFKKSGSSPARFGYGTEYIGEAELLNAKSDTANIYDFATHGSHVAGIAGGSGPGNISSGVAFEANYLLVTFLVDEAAVIDAFSWMKQKAEEANKRLVVNMSWGLDNLGTLDGTSLISQAINQMSKEGVVFVTSGGNNGDENLHIKKEFNSDTLKTGIAFYPYSAHPEMWGQNITMWGEPGKPFGAGFMVYNTANKLLLESSLFNSGQGPFFIDSFLLVNADTIFYRAEVERAHYLNNRPLVRLVLKNTNTALKIGIKAFAKSGTIHLWNVVELNNDVGNWGLPLVKYFADWTAGDNRYSLGEPAITQSAITVAAHASEFVRPDGVVVGGAKASFSSIGPTMDDRQKPDVSAPGVGIESSISSFTTASFTTSGVFSFNGKNYPFARFSGTSMSSPATTGVVALMLQANPYLTSQEVKTILKQTARLDKNTGDLSANGDYTWGFGKVNAIEAVKEAERLIQFYRPDENGYVWPNPTLNSLNFFAEEMGFDDMLECKLYSTSGKLVMSSQIGLHQNAKLNVADLPNGLYILRVYGDSVYTHKVLIARF